MITRRGFLALLGSAIAAVNLPFVRQAPTTLNLSAPVSDHYRYTMTYLMADGTEIPASDASLAVALRIADAELKRFAARRLYIDGVDHGPIPQGAIAVHHGAPIAQE